MHSLAERYRALQASRGIATEEMMAARLAEICVTAPEPGRWIRAQVDADYIGEPMDPARFRLAPTWVSIRAVKPIDAPPAPDPDDLPMLHARLSNVRAISPDDDVLLVTLFDARIHEPTVVGHVEEKGRGSAFLRVRGTLYARATRVEDLPEAEDELWVDVPWQDEPGVEIERVPLPPIEREPDPGYDKRPDDMDRTDGCASLGCLGIPFAMALMYMFWVTCGPMTASTWIGTLLVANYIRRIENPIDQSAYTAVASVWIVGAQWGLLGLFLLRAGRYPCNEVSPLWLVPFSMLVIMSSFLKFKGVPLLLTGVAWTVGAWAWCGDAVGTCSASDRQQKVQLVGGMIGTGAELQSLGVAVGGTFNVTVDRVEEVLAIDQNAQVVADATRRSAEPRTSVDEALAAPDAFFEKCGQPLYLSGDILFPSGSAELSEASKPHLRKLGRLIRTHEGVPVLLAGHADASGDPEVNRKLSRQRAQNVATWLIEEADIDAKRVHVIGRGSAMPIVRDPTLWHLNRRVELIVPCNDLEAAE